MTIPLTRPIVLAHRGASADHPENTLRAFRAALEMGADGVELDVRLTADGVPVVLHDEDVGATTDGQGRVTSLTLEQLKHLDASGGRGPRQEVPTLEEALRAIAEAGRAVVDIEVKNLPGQRGFDSPREAALEASLRVLSRAGFPGSVIISSFNWITLRRSRRLAPHIPTGFLTAGRVDARMALAYVRRAGHQFVLPNVRALLRAGRPFVQEAHRRGIHVGTWTVDDEETLDMLFRWGVDAVTSNRPALAVAVRDAVAS